MVPGNGTLIIEDPTEDDEGLYQCKSTNEYGTAVSVKTILKAARKNVRVFFEMQKSGNNANIGIRGFISWKQNISVTKCYPSKYWTCKTDTLSSLYSHALLILTESSKSKHQVVHEQKFKDLLSSTWQVSTERSMLDLEWEVQ